MRYQSSTNSTIRDRRWPKRVFYTLLILVMLFIAGAVIAQYVYRKDLQPVGTDHTVKYVIVPSGSSVPQIAQLLSKNGLIKSTEIFEWYINVHNDRGKLQAGTYQFASDQSVQQIVDKLVNGNIATDLVTILPGQRIDQIRNMFIKSGFSADAVDAALSPSQYAGKPALSDKPVNASLDGFLYPDSYQKDSTTNPKVIIGESLDEMQSHLTPAIRSAFATEGLSVYQGVTLASIVEKEVSKSSDRPQVAQVFLKRIQMGMTLGSDVTAFYGAILAGQKPTTDYDTPYNTLIHKGLPPGPIASVSASSLNAVAHPAATDWLFFVSGDNGNTYFSKTLAEHQALTAQYCHKLCSASN
jgi:UPF0755 protein